jgi:hypothetical protein
LNSSLKRLKRALVVLFLLPGLALAAPATPYLGTLACRTRNLMGDLYLCYLDSRMGSASWTGLLWAYPTGTTFHYNQCLVFLFSYEKSVTAASSLDSQQGKSDSHPVSDLEASETRRLLWTPSQPRSFSASLSDSRPVACPLPFQRPAVLPCCSMAFEFWDAKMAYDSPARRSNSPLSWQVLA